MQHGILSPSNNFIFRVVCVRESRAAIRPIEPTNYIVGYLQIGEQYVSAFISYIIHGRFLFGVTRNFVKEEERGKRLVSHVMPVSRLGQEYRITKLNVDWKLIILYKIAAGSDRFDRDTLSVSVLLNSLMK